MKLCHEESVGLSILNEETSKLEDAMHVEYFMKHGSTYNDVILYDRVYHALAEEKRRLMYDDRGAEVRACWVLLATSCVGGKPVKAPRLHFVDYSSRTFNVRRVNGGTTLLLKAHEVPSEAQVQAMNRDPEDPLWDIYLPMLHPNYIDPTEDK